MQESGCRLRTRAFTARLARSRARPPTRELLHTCKPVSSAASFHCRLRRWRHPPAFPTRPRVVRATDLAGEFGGAACEIGDARIGVRTIAGRPARIVVKQRGRGSATARDSLRKPIPGTRSHRREPMTPADATKAAKKRIRRPRRARRECDPSLTPGHCPRGAERRKRGPSPVRRGLNNVQRIGGDACTRMSACDCWWK